MPNDHLSGLAERLRQGQHGLQYPEDPGPSKGGPAQPV